MTTPELITLLQRSLAEHGPLPVVMVGQSGGGQVDAVKVEFDMLERRFEVWLVENP
jgi:hypothetical protein